MRITFFENINSEFLGIVEEFVELFFGEHVNTEYVLPSEAGGGVRKIRIGIALVSQQRQR